MTDRGEAGVAIVGAGRSGLVTARLLASPELQSSSWRLRDRFGSAERLSQEGADALSGARAVGRERS